MLLKRIYDVSGDFAGNVMLVTGEKNFILDAGMGYAGEKLAENIQKVFDSQDTAPQASPRKLDYIFLTHSHYDHISGVPALKKHWPEAKVVIAPYGKKILEKPSALAMIRSMNANAAKLRNLPEPDYSDDEMKADLEARENLVYDCGDLTVRSIDTPGHTKDCVSYIIEEKAGGENALLCCESMAAYSGPEHGFIACHLTGFYTSLCSIRKMRAVNADHLIFSHYGPVDSPSPDELFDQAEAALLRAAYQIRIEAEKNLPADESVKNLSAVFWPKGIDKFQPYEAYAANMKAMLRTIMNEMPFDKPSVRRFVKARRRELAPEDKAVMDAKVLENLNGLLKELYPQLPYLYAYVSYAKETDTIRLIEQTLAEGKSHVIVPRVNGERMDLIEIHSLDDLEPGCMGIPEPKAALQPSAEMPEEALTAPVVTPGLGFTRTGKRCGYGGGFYDRFFADEPKHPKIAICYSFQIMENIETEPTDQTVDYIVTDTEVISCKA